MKNLEIMQEQYKNEELKKENKVLLERLEILEDQMKTQRHIN